MDGRSSHQRSPQWSPLSDNDYGDEVKWNSSEASNKEQDWHLPIANVGRIMKKSLPANAKISKEAKGIIQECVSEFIGFVTGEASDKCQREKRKTINGDDLLWAMATLGFQDYAVYLKVYMNKYRETEGDQNSIAIESDHSLNSVAKEGDRSPMEEVTYKNSLLNSTISSNPNHEGMAMNMHLSSIIPEFYSLGAPMAHSYVSGGEVGAYGPDQPRLDDFTVNLGGRNETGDADVAALAAYYSHGVVQRF